jgi:hypothetical protein
MKSKSLISRALFLRLGRLAITLHFTHPTRVRYQWFTLSHWGYDYERLDVLAYLKELYPERTDIVEA